MSRPLTVQELRNWLKGKDGRAFIKFNYGSIEVKYRALGDQVDAKEIKVLNDVKPGRQ